MLGTCIDSRSLTKDNCSFHLKDNVDGHRFVKQALADGVSLLQKTYQIHPRSDYSSRRYFKALQDLAKAYLKYVNKKLLL